MARDSVLFDVNETLLDLGSLGPKFSAVFGDREASSSWFALLLHGSTVCALTGVPATFEELAASALELLAMRRKIVVSRAQRLDIVEGFGRLPAHSDVVPALSRLRSSGYRTVAFSNSSWKLVARQLESAGLTAHFDDVISVEGSGSFKPDAKVYLSAVERISRSASEVRLVAAHDWDTHGAMAAGLRAAYVDRFARGYHPLYRTPEIEAKDLKDAVDQILVVDAVG